MTIFAPAARHFLVHASALSLAPLAPHLSSLTQPLTVSLFPMSSNAIADMASRKNDATVIINTFLIAGSSPEFEIKSAGLNPRSQTRQRQNYTIFSACKLSGESNQTIYHF